MLFGRIRNRIGNFRKFRRPTLAQHGSQEQPQEASRNDQKSRTAPRSTKNGPRNPKRVLGFPKVSKNGFKIIQKSFQHRLQIVMFFMTGNLCRSLSLCFSCATYLQICFLQGAGGRGAACRIILFSYYLIFLVSYSLNRLWVAQVLNCNSFQVHKLWTAKGLRCKSFDLQQLRVARSWTVPGILSCKSFELQKCWVAKVLSPTPSGPHPTTPPFRSPSHHLFCRCLCEPMNMLYIR